MIYQARKHHSLAIRAVKAKLVYKNSTMIISK